MTELFNTNMAESTLQQNNSEQQAKWVKRTDNVNLIYWFECSHCGEEPPRDNWGNEWHSPFCPSCGKMMIEDFEEYKEEDDEW